LTKKRGAAYVIDSNEIEDSDREKGANTCPLAEDMSWLLNTGGLRQHFMKSVIILPAQGIKYAIFFVHLMELKKQEIILDFVNNILSIINSPSRFSFVVAETVWTDYSPSGESFGQVKEGGRRQRDVRRHKK